MHQCNLTVQMKWMLITIIFIIETCLVWMEHLLQGFDKFFPFWIINRSQLSLISILTIIAMREESGFHSPLHRLPTSDSRVSGKVKVTTWTHGWGNMKQHRFYLREWDYNYITNIFCEIMWFFHIFCDF